MNEYPRPDEPTTPPFPLDRVVSYAILVYVGVGFALTLLAIDRSWAKTQETGSIGLLPYVGRGWMVHARYVVTVASYAWLSAGLRRSRPWSIALLAFASTGDVLLYVRSLYPYGLIVSGAMLLYALLRLVGALGSRSGDPFALQN